MDITASIWAELEGESFIDYASLPPLDGEEGELIDDEACFIDVRTVTGVGKCFFRPFTPPAPPATGVADATK